MPYQELYRVAVRPTREAGVGVTPGADHKTPQMPVVVEGAEALVVLPLPPQFAEIPYHVHHARGLLDSCQCKIVYPHCRRFLSLGRQPL